MARVRVADYCAIKHGVGEATETDTSSATKPTFYESINATLLDDTVLIAAVMHNKGSQFPSSDV